MSRGRTALLIGSLIAFAVGLALAFTAGELVLAPSAPRGQAPDLDAVRRAAIIPMDDLPDAAVAVYDSAAPRIYLNTRLLAQVGPELAAFLRAHEEGHLAYRHVPARRFGLVRVETPTPVLHAYEFAADCYAAQVLRHERPAAVQAAIRFFQQRPDLVTDAAHPPMGERADRLRKCFADRARTRAPRR